MNTVIFDMDGVLVDSEPVYEKSNHRYFEKHNISVSASEYSSYIGISLHEMCEQLIDNHNLNKSPTDLKNDIYQFNLNDIRNHINAPIDGITALLHRLELSGFTIGLASSSPLDCIDIILEQIGIKKYFEIVVSGDQVQRSKPDPEIFLKCAALLKAKPLDCIVVEDSTHGVTAAKAANMFCIGYNNSNSFNQDLSKCDLLVNEFNPQIIEGIVNLLVQ